MIMAMLIISVPVGYLYTIAFTYPIHAQVQLEQQQQSSSSPTSQQQEGQRVSTPSSPSSTSSSSGRVMEFGIDSESDDVDTLPASTLSPLQDDSGGDNNTSQENLITGSFGGDRISGTDGNDIIIGLLGTRYYKWRRRK